MILAQLKTVVFRLVDVEGLQEMLSIGRSTAAIVGEEAGAVVRIGRRKLYNVAKVAAYMDKLTEE